MLCQLGVVPQFKIFPFHVAFYFNCKYIFWGFCHKHRNIFIISKQLHICMPNMNHSSIIFLYKVFFVLYNIYVVTSIWENQRTFVVLFIRNNLNYDGEPGTTGVIPLSQLIFPKTQNCSLKYETALEWWFWFVLLCLLNLKLTVQIKKYPCFFFSDFSVSSISSSPEVAESLIAHFRYIEYWRIFAVKF